MNEEVILRDRGAPCGQTAKGKQNEKKTNYLHESFAIDTGQRGVRFLNYFMNEVSIRT